MPRKVDLKRLVDQELAKRGESKNVLDYCFSQQLSFLQDQAIFKAALTTRRAGKSSALGVDMVTTCLQFPNTNLLYIGLTKDSAANAIVDDIVSPICRKFKVITTGSKYQVKFDNGSCIYLTGLNASPQELEKVLGQKHRKIFLDECQSHIQDTKKLIFQVLVPCVQDYNGQIIMTGTPCDNTATYFYEVTKQEGERAPGWSVHEWNTLDNIAIQEDGLSQAQKHEAQIRKLKETTPNIEETDWFQQQFIGKWVINTSLKVYKFNDDRNVIINPEVIQSLADKRSWRFVLGIDFGFEDDSALVVLGYRSHDPHVYVLHAEKHKHWTLTDIANRVRDLQLIYRFTFMVGDSAAKQSIQEIARHHNLPIKPSDKTGSKAGFVALVNADMITCSIQIDPTNAKSLIEEMKHLVLDPRKLAEEGKWKELSSKDNHVCDAFLYGYRFCRAYRAKPAPEELPPNIQAYEQLKAAGLLPKPSIQHARLPDSIFEDKPDDTRRQQFLADFKRRNKP